MKNVITNSLKNETTMKRWQKLLALSVIFMFTCSLGFAQTPIKGKVIDEDGNPLPGVNIVIEGTTIGVVTNIDGLFNIRANTGQKLMVRFIGMKSQLIEIKNAETFINVTLVTEFTQLDELVVVGYGTQKKESIVGSIATAKAEDIKMQGNVSNMTDALTGIIPGLTVLSVSGMPGGDLESDTKIYTPSEILIRGKTTWNDAGPLILVDGVERLIGDVDINEVESVSVLKDASATAVFGVKGGNGVILITTKRGTEGKAQFSIEAEMSFETPSKYIETVDMAEASIARNIAIERTRRLNPGVWDLYYSDEEVNYFRTGKYPYAYQNLRWSDVLLKDFEMSHRVNMTVRGGTKKVKYFASASYNHVGDIMNSEDLGQGYIPSYSYDRLNIRSNFDFELTKTTKLQANFAAMFGLRSTPPSTTREGLFGGLLFQSGDSPILRYEDGVYGDQDPQFFAYNSYYKLNYNGVRSEPRTMVNMDYTLTQNLDFITEGLKVSGKLAYDNTFRNDGRGVNETGYPVKTIDKNFYLNGGYYDYETETYMLEGAPANMDEYTDWTYPTSGTEGFDWVKEPITYRDEEVDLKKADRTLYYEVKLDYAKSFDVHGVTAMAMFSRQESERGSNWPKKREDWVGRVTYDYDHRYLFEANGAYNGSEKFGPLYRFDFFPSVAAGWMLSNERFIKDNVSWLDELKVRYSYGLVGNDNVDLNGVQWPYATVWGTYNWTESGSNPHEATYYGYPSPYKEYTKYDEGNPGNPYLHWEIATKQNLGIEIGVFNNKLNLTADFFKEDREDMLISGEDRTLPPLTGKPATTANIGKAKTHGAEIEIMYRSKFKEIDFWVSANWTFARGEVIYKETPELVEEHQRPEGKPIDFTKTGISNGFIESWDDFYGAPPHANITETGVLLPGDLIMVDFNSDGKYNSSDDNAPYGYPKYPQNNYGINAGATYKGFELSVRFLGAYNATRRIGDDIFYNDNLYVPTYLLEDTWTPEYSNENPTYPALVMKYQRNKYMPSDPYTYWDASFFRLQSAQLAYSLPKRWTKPMGINNLKLYVNGRNLFLWTKMPNDGVGFTTGKNYPTKKQVNIGLNIQF
jgi:TonB-linked SusC/RagA family outer membrane protein